jgi:putative addiction module component (TIGR02574 family)
MSSREEVLKKILALPEEDRRWLVEEVAPTLPALEEDFELTAEQRAELDRRVADAHAHPEKLVPWEEVKRRVQSRINHEAKRHHLG